MNRANWAVDFAGDNDYITFGNIFNVGSGSFCIEGWFMLDSNVTNGNNLFIKRTSAINAMYWFYIDSSTSKLTAYLRNSGGTSVSFAGSATISTGVWYHTAFVRNGNDHYIYLNGAVDGSKNQTAVNTDNSEALELGTDRANSKYANIKLADWRFWSNYRTQEEIQQNMFKRLIGTESNLYIYVPMDEGTGTTATDRSGNGRNGTLTNFSGTYWVDGAPISGSGAVLYV